MRGRNTSSPATSLPTASPVQRIVPSEVRTNCSSGAWASLAARASISPASTFCAAACNAFASDPPADGSAAKRKPSSRPTRWPSTVTSPVFEISLSNVVFSRSRRINTLVRRSTKRAVRRSWSASDSLSSTARVTPCQCSGSASQSCLLATNVQVRTCAIRLERESMSPSGWSACATWRANQSSGILPSLIRNP